MSFVCDVRVARPVFRDWFKVRAADRKGTHRSPSTPSTTTSSHNPRTCLSTPSTYVPLNAQAAPDTHQDCRLPASRKRRLSSTSPTSLRMSSRISTIKFTLAYARCYARFCGKITSVQFDPSAHTATLNFEKPSAAKTALMLNGGTLDGAHLTITSDIEHQDKDDSAHADHIDQTDKPRAGSKCSRHPRVNPRTDQVLQLRQNISRADTPSPTRSSSARSSSTSSAASRLASCPTSRASTPNSVRDR